MNVSDTEIVASILENAGYSSSETMESADIILVNTCAIREGAEKRIWNTPIRCWMVQMEEFRRASRIISPTLVLPSSFSLN